jgi:predicted NAD/FAD-dependent oxidoreductase
MVWHLGEDELARALALDVDARYAYAINKISEEGELWTLKSDDGCVVSTNPYGVSTQRPEPVR